MLGCWWLHAADDSRDLEKIPEAPSHHRLPAGQLPASSRASSSFCLKVAPQPPALSKVSTLSPLIEHLLLCSLPGWEGPLRIEIHLLSLYSQLCVTE